uniref:Uncharacterized protein n=1 Tax=Knipowitschia caucasica TaxID=637954 RepID=A0AAV2JGD5_KNICA
MSPKPNSPVRPKASPPAFSLDGLLDVPDRPKSVKPCSPVAAHPGGSRTESESHISLCVLGSTWQQERRNCAPTPTKKEPRGPSRLKPPLGFPGPIPAPCSRVWERLECVRARSPCARKTETPCGPPGDCREIRLRAHCWSQRTPTGLDCMGWRRQLSYSTPLTDPHLSLRQGPEHSTARPHGVEHLPTCSCVVAAMRTQQLGSHGAVPLPVSSIGSSGSSLGLSPGSDSDGSSPTGSMGTGTGLGVGGGQGGGGTLRGLLSHYWSLESLHSTTGKIRPW